jgi:hypothetical protein
MRCRDFLEHYSDFRDGRITDRDDLQRMQQHLRACHRCRRFHWAIREGVDLLRAQQPLEPTPAFRHALRARLATAAASGAHRQGALLPGAVTVATLLAVAAALLFYEGLMRTRSRGLARSGAAVPVVIVNPGTPFVSFTAAPETSGGTLARWVAEDRETLPR